MNKKINLEEDFEYNDGLGDLLREKDNHVFSWLKTIIVIISLLSIIILTILVIIKVSQSFIVKTPETNLPYQHSFQTQPSTEKQIPSIISKETPTLYRVVVGSFLLSSPARKMVTSLKKRSIPAYVWIYKGPGKTVYRVQVGAFSKLKIAKRFEASLKSRGFDAYIVKQ